MASPFTLHSFLRYKTSWLKSRGVYSWPEGSTRCSPVRSLRLGRVMIMAVGNKSIDFLARLE